MFLPPFSFFELVAVPVGVRLFARQPIVSRVACHSSPSFRSSREPVDFLFFFTLRNQLPLSSRSMARAKERDLSKEEGNSDAVT